MTLTMALPAACAWEESVAIAHAIRKAPLYQPAPLISCVSQGTPREQARHADVVPAHSRCPSPLVAMQAAPATRSLSAAEEPVRAQVEKVMALMADGREAAERGDYDAALSSYTAIVERFPDLALAERARVTRALLLYQVRPGPLNSEH